MKENILWDPLLDAIQDEQCVLCIGPGVFTNKDGVSFEKQLLVFLEERGYLDDDIICYPDGLFFFRKENKRNNVLSGIKRFHKQSFPLVDSIYNLLTEIPFSLVILLTPDNRYVQLAEDNGFAVFSDYYHSYHTPRFKERPSKNFPIAYNMFGSLEEMTESVILTYDDLFEFITDMTKTDRRSTEIRKYIKDARHFICIGLPFGKWYMQLLLRILEMHTNKNLTKYAADQGNTDREVLSLYKDQFDITFIPDNIDIFVKHLHQRCQKENILSKKRTSSTSAKEDVRELLAQNNIEEGINLIEAYLKSAPDLEGVYGNESSHLKRRMYMNESERRKNIISLDEYRREADKIANDILNLADKLFKQI
jgi:hypothetical protein